MTVATLEGVTARTVDSARLRTRVLFTGPEHATPVLFLHGNLSSAAWWEETMLGLPDGWRGIAPDLRGYGGADPAAKIDAKRGVDDLVDDTVALLDNLAIDRVHLVGNSLGGTVVWRLIALHSERLASVTQADPGSPWGFVGTRDALGSPTTADFAGSGAGLVNPLFLAALKAGDSGSESPFSPRSVLRALVVRPPFIPAREDALVGSMLETHLGDDAYPGDVEPSPNWPFFAPGVFGPNNALSPKYATDPAEMLAADLKPPILWVRGSHDLVVSDSAAGDPGFWGPLGLLEGYPGQETFPPQPMVSQIRHLLDGYESAGGHVAEAVIDDCGHVPFIERPSEFNRALHAHLAANHDN